jgi:hypothetical protein
LINPILNLVVHHCFGNEGDDTHFTFVEQLYQGYDCIHCHVTLKHMNMKIIKVFDLKMDLFKTLNFFVDHNLSQTTCRLHLHLEFLSWLFIMGVIHELHAIS